MTLQHAFATVTLLAALLAVPTTGRAAGPIPIVAAENFYGDVAGQIGGAEVTVTSILNSPDQDPHLFETSPSVGRMVSAARIVIYNGIDYDPWMRKLLAATSGVKRTTIVVADLVGRKPGDNPHIWYDPATMLALAKALAADLSASIRRTRPCTSSVWRSSSAPCSPFWPRSPRCAPALPARR